MWEKGPNHLISHLKPGDLQGGKSLIICIETYQEVHISFFAKYKIARTDVRATLF